jgi:hypothetical protein
VAWAETAGSTLQRKVLDNIGHAASLQSMPLPRPAPPHSSEPEIPIHHRAIENLRYIREAMERAGPFTAVPGWGGVAMGATAAVAAFIAHQQPTTERWLLTWLAEGWLAFAIGGLSMVRKASSSEESLLSGRSRRFVLAYAPPILVGGLLTLALYRLGLVTLLPAVWLLLYGAAVVTGGALSVPVVPVMGACFIVMGAVTLSLPAAWGDLMMGLGFGLLHVVFGLWIAWRYGG